MNKRKLEYVFESTKRQKQNQAEEIKCLIFLTPHLSRIHPQTFTIFLPKNIFDDCDTSYIYNEVCSLFPKNDWTDMILDSVEYHKDMNVLNITCY